MTTIIANTCMKLTINKAGHLQVHSSSGRMPRTAHRLLSSEGGGTRKGGDPEEALRQQPLISHIRQRPASARCKGLHPLLMMMSPLVSARLSHHPACRPLRAYSDAV